MTSNYYDSIGCIFDMMQSFGIPFPDSISKLNDCIYVFWYKNYNHHVIKVFFVNEICTVSISVLKEGEYVNFEDEFYEFPEVLKFNWLDLWNEFAAF